MKGIEKIIGFLAVLAMLFVSCSADGDATGSDFDDFTASNDSRSSIARSAATVEQLDDAANVRHILGETVITTPDLMTLLDGKLSDWGQKCINAWNKSLTTKGDSETDKKEQAELYERAIDVYGSVALFDRDITNVILAEIDNPQDKDAVVKWQDSNIGQRR